MGSRNWPMILSTLLRREELSEADAHWAMSEIIAGEAADAQLAAFAVLLRAKGETAAELAGLAAAMLERTEPLRIDRDCVDVVGTGGDGAHTVNISTMAAVVTAGADVPVVKHGNRAASSKCGAADLLEELGVVLDLGPQGVARCVEEVGIGFCFAAKFHSGMRHAAASRRAMGVPTAFNLLGPLTNPAQPRAGAVGCADRRMAPVVARVLADRGSSAVVVRGEDGLDELSLGAPSRVWLTGGGTVVETLVDPSELGLEPAPLTALRGGDAAYNAEAARELLRGRPGPIRDAVLLNAAAAFASHDGASSAAEFPAALRRGIERAADSIDSGAAAEVLERWVRTGQEAAATS